MKWAHCFFLSSIVMASLCLVRLADSDVSADERDEIWQEMEHVERELKEIEEILEREDRDIPEREVDKLMQMRKRLANHLEELERHARHDKEAEEEERSRHFEREEREHEHEERDDDRDHRHQREEREEGHDHDGDRQHDEMEHHARSLEIHARELELQKLRLSLEASRHEVASRVSKLAQDKHAFFAYSLRKVVESSHDPDHAIEVARGLMGRTDDPVARRILQSQLAQLHQSVGHPDQARDALLSILSGGDRTVRKKQVRSERKSNDDKKESVNETRKRVFVRELSK